MIDLSYEEARMLYRAVHAAMLKKEGEERERYFALLNKIETLVEATEAAIAGRMS